jgi:hypothetical protein
MKTTIYDYFRKNIYFYRWRIATWFEVEKALFEKKLINK